MLDIKDDSSVSAAIIRIKDMGNRVSKLKTTALRVVALATLEACADYTPVRSGNLLMNWHIGPTGARDDYDSTLKDAYEEKVDASIVAGKGLRNAPPRAPRGPLMSELMSRAEDEALDIDRDKNVSRVVVYNPAPYAPAVDNGSSTNNPAGMTEAGRAAAGIAIAAFRYGTAMDDFKHLGTPTKIGQRSR